MKRLFLFAIALLCLQVLPAQTNTAGTADPDDPVVGYWIATKQKTGEKQCGWRFYVSNGMLYGVILSAHQIPRDMTAVHAHASYKDFPVAGKVNTMLIIGTPWIFNLKRIGQGKWSGGYIINPGDGNCYRCTITYHAADGKKYKTTVIEMRGELVGLPLGMSQYWPSSSKEEAENIQ